MKTTLGGRRPWGAGFLLAGAAAGRLLAADPEAAAPVADRIAGRSFPSVFQAWNPAENLTEDRWKTAARHDLIFAGPSFFSLEWDRSPPGEARGFTPASVRKALERRAALLALNSNLVLLAEIRYRDAPASYLPEGHPWWLRNAAHQVEKGWDEGGYRQLDITSVEFRAQVADQAAAAVKSGVVDGVMLDWWQDDPHRLDLVKGIRMRIGERALILVNANDRRIPQSAPFVNGCFMECYRSRTAADWTRIADTLAWAEANLRAPRVNCLETWYHASRDDLSLMRATTTLSLVLSDGYSLFSDPNPLPTPDHLHNWYAFWETRLGRPLGPGRRQPDGAFVREFGGGTAIYNPMGNAAVRVSFDQPKTSTATGRRAPSHDVAPCDGDLFVKDEAVRTLPPPSR